MINDQANKMPVVWTISSSDSCAGTGVQADLHTFHDFEVYGCTVITAINAQNSFALGYSLATERRGLVAQINALDSDMPAAAIKVGRLPNLESVEVVSKYLQDFDGTVVYDPELDTDDLLLAEAGDALKASLFPCVDLLVVNSDEASAFSQASIDSAETMEAVATQLLAMGVKAVLITGARFASQPTQRFDYWADGSRHLWVAIESIDTVNNRGGGSTLSAAIIAAFARGEDIDTALALAKAYVTRGIRQANVFGSGPGSVAHLGMPVGEEDLPFIGTELPV